jgi:hypothetical protein
MNFEDSLERNIHLSKQLLMLPSHHPAQEENKPCQGNEARKCRVTRYAVANGMNHREIRSHVGFNRMARDWRTLSRTLMIPFNITAAGKF